MSSRLREGADGEWQPLDSRAGIACFEHTIPFYSLLVFFLPLLVDSSGNAAMMTGSAITVRSMPIGARCDSSHPWREENGRAPPLPTAQKSVRNAVAHAAMDSLARSAWPSSCVVPA